MPQYELLTPSLQVEGIACGNINNRMILMETMQDLMTVWETWCRKNGNYLRNSWTCCSYNSFRLSLNRENVTQTMCLNRVTITFLNVCFGKGGDCYLQF